MKGGKQISIHIYLRLSLGPRSFVSVGELFSLLIQQLFSGTIDISMDGLILYMWMCLGLP